MALANYTDLKASVASWLNRSDLTSQIPDFIALAEAQFNRVLRTRQMLVRNTGYTISSQYTALPSDFLQLDNIKIANGTGESGLEHLAVNDYTDKLRSFANATGTPGYYSIIGGYLAVARIPDVSYTGEMLYFGSIPAMSANATNWLLTKHPDLYLYGALLQSAPYLKEDERVEVWRSMYGTAMAEIQLEEERARFSGAPPRTISRRVIG